MKKRNLYQVSPIPTNHGVGMKRVLLAKEETESPITQIAVTILQKGEEAQKHSHDNMEEYFFLQKGKLLLTTDTDSLEMEAGDFVTVPAHVPHTLKALEASTLMTIGVEVFY